MCCCWRLCVSAASRLNDWSSEITCWLSRCLEGKQVSRSSPQPNMFSNQWHHHFEWSACWQCFSRNYFFGLQQNSSSVEHGTSQFSDRNCKIIKGIGGLSESLLFFLEKRDGTNPWTHFLFIFLPLPHLILQPQKIPSNPACSLAWWSWKG